MGGHQSWEFVQQPCVVVCGGVRIETFSRWWVSKQRPHGPAGGAQTRPTCVAAQPPLSPLPCFGGLVSQISVQGAKRKGSMAQASRLKVSFVILPPMQTDW